MNNEIINTIVPNNKKGKNLKKNILNVYILSGFLEGVNEKMNKPKRANSQIILDVPIGMNI
ncbi:hypothetical protein [Providencia stuartii]|uniref:hypothetical protein n=1 Tax=Providencia stuartii TaxID=588 RepID=UPI00300C52CA